MIYTKCESTIHHYLVRAQGNRVWKSERRKSERSENRFALSLRSWSGFHNFYSRIDVTNPNANPLGQG